MNRFDICPSCRTALRWMPPDEIGWMRGAWVCPRCKYARGEGDPKNPMKKLKRKRKRG